MNTKATTDLTFTGHDETRCIDDDRLTRALTQDMEVATRDDPLAYAVTHDGETYDVDVDTGVCGCGDYVHRGDDVVCKHVVRAALTHAFRGVRNPALVARVLGRTEELGCVHDVRGCAGPTTTGTRGIPCEDCIDATPGHWSVWCRLHGRDCDVDAELDHAGPVALADGGATTAPTATTDTEMPETCDHCGEPESASRTLRTAEWADGLDLVCGPCLLDPEVDPFGGEDETVENAHGDEVPARTETADFGGGEGGVDEL